MPLIILNQSICPMCKGILKDTDNLSVFQPFVANTNDPLYFFNDRAFHQECITSHPLYMELMQRYRAMGKKCIDMRQRPCDVCHKILTVEEFVKDDIFTLPYISYGNPDFERFDYLYVHSHCIPNYESIQELQNALQQIKDEGWWGGNTIDFKLTYIKMILNNPDNIPSLNFLYKGKGKSIDQIAEQKQE